MSKKCSTFTYKGYIGSVEVDQHTMSLRGKILCINGLVTYRADTVPELEKEFHSAVDDYLEFCEQEGLVPEESLSGTFNVRIGPDLHLAAKRYAMQHNMVINEVVKEGVERLVSEEKTQLHHHTIELKHPVEPGLGLVKHFESTINFPPPRNSFPDLLESLTNGNYDAEGLDQPH